MSEERNTNNRNGIWDFMYSAPTVSESRQPATEAYVEEDGRFCDYHVSSGRWMGAMTGTSTVQYSERSRCGAVQGR